MEYGKGLRSIRTRFTLLIGGFCLIGALVTTLLIAHDSWASEGYLKDIGVIFLVTAIPALVTYYLAGTLTQSISALKSSAEAIASGEFDRPVEVDCQCEVGGLAVSFQRMVQRLNSNIVRMNVLAYTDPLTGLSNRAVVHHLLECALADEQDFSCALLFIDIDHFKRINDTLGHESGDELLRQISSRIVERGLNRTIDTLDRGATAFGELYHRPPEDVVVARFAGDEFIAILPGVHDEASVAARALAILDSLQEPFIIDDQPVSITASIGIARSPLDTRDPTELLSFADVAMYAAKKAGRSQFAFFDESDRNELLEQSRLERELKVALKSDQFCLHFQPKLDAQTLETRGVEALVRWNHPRLGLIAPSRFIDLAEKAGLMCDLGYIVMQLVIAQARQFQRDGMPLSIAMNISPTQFRNPRFVPSLTRLLQENEVPPSMIQLEVTESVAMDNFEMASEKLAALRAAGMKTAIDDFGVGFSNLTQIVNLPFDLLKIDMSLIQGIGISKKTESVILALISLSQSLGYTTIAEGIETEEQFQFLRKNGCDLIQGFYFARPMTAELLTEWMAAGRKEITAPVRYERARRRTG